ncbi:Maf family nucleotide pyrophosphatase [Zunongwangia sp.]|uniref:Maf family nucleotide pyrophosphatase n=1 Tax=Zunongwangia sp. TaxID=1965325 RepID=UPI003AA9DCB6
MLHDILQHKEIILASGSPRRQQFFKDLLIPFTTDVRPVIETYPNELKGTEITDYLAKLKATVFTELTAKQILITSDTIVSNNGKAMGKPRTINEAKEMLVSLSGKTHSVETSVCFTTTSQQKIVHSSTQVTFKVLTEAEIDFYVENYKPFDKAGGYAIQEWIGFIGITHIEGSYFNVVGLPTHLVYETLTELASV